MKTHKNVEWLIIWFSQKSEIPLRVEDKNYFEIGLIDSLGVMELIEDIEKEFRIRFTEENFQDRRFSIIAGLSEIIAEHTDHVSKNQGGDNEQ